MGVIAALLGVHKNIVVWVFVHADEGQCSCAFYLVREQFRKVVYKCEIYLVQGAFAQVKRGHHSFIR